MSDSFEEQIISLTPRSQLQDGEFDLHCPNCGSILKAVVSETLYHTEVWMEVYDEIRTIDYDSTNHETCESNLIEIFCPTCRWTWKKGMDIQNPGDLD